MNCFLHHELMAALKRSRMQAPKKERENRIKKLSVSFSRCIESESKLFHAECVTTTKNVCQVEVEVMRKLSRLIDSQVFAQNLLQQTSWTAEKFFLNVRTFYGNGLKQDILMSLTIEGG